MGTKSARFLTSMTLRSLRLKHLTGKMLPHVEHQRLTVRHQSKVLTHDGVLRHVLTRTGRASSAWAYIRVNIDIPARYRAVTRGAFSYFSLPECEFCLLAGMIVKTTPSRARRLMVAPRVGAFITAFIMVKVGNEILFSATMREQAFSSGALSHGACVTTSTFRHPICNETWCILVANYQILLSNE
jgi:hypothetical protein